MKKIEAVAFDFDGTLYSFESIRRPFLMRYWYRAKSIRAFLRARQVMREERFSGPEEMLSFQDRWVAERLNISPKKARARFEKLMIKGLASCLKPSRQRVGLEDFLNVCIEKEIKIILISDLPVDDKLKAIGLAHFPWAAKVAADDIGVLKPRPEIFQTAFEQAKCDPANSIYIGDREDTDGEGAFGLDMTFIQMATTSRKKMDQFIKSDWPVFQNFEQVSSYLF
jgi:FMN phosphatase YigB (HAD superfamily)